eukprot:gene19527-biopygen17167
MGGYALLRFNCQILPDAHAQFAPLLIVLGVVNIIYAALTSFAQRNLKRKIAYSSISHMGFVLIGIGSFSRLHAGAEFAFPAAQSLPQPVDGALGTFRCQTQIHDSLAHRFVIRAQALQPSVQDDAVSDREAQQHDHD